MNDLVGKIFEDRKNSERKVVVTDYKISGNDIEVVTIKFLDGCGKKAGTVEDKFLKSFKKSWKEADEVIEETVEHAEQVEESEHKLVPMTGIEKSTDLKTEYSKEQVKEVVKAEIELDSVIKKLQEAGFIVNIVKGLPKTISIKKVGQLAISKNGFRLKANLKFEFTTETSYEPTKNYNKVMCATLEDVLRIIQ